MVQFGLAGMVMLAQLGLPSINAACVDQPKFIDSPLIKNVTVNFGVPNDWFDCVSAHIANMRRELNTR